jgi:YfiH family protein
MSLAPSSELCITAEGPTVVAFPELEASGVCAAVSTRLGGVSEGPFASLNLGRGVGDDPDRVAENRRRLLAGVGLEGRRLVGGHQVHGDAIARATPDGPDELPGVDALYTTDTRVALRVLVADCTPVFVVAPDVGAVAAAHAGWRGTLAGVAGKLVRRLVTDLGARPSAMRAAIGPAAGRCCYEVGDEVLAAYRAAYPWADDHIAGRRLDLHGLNRRQLVEAGVPAERIAVADLCTICHPELFFSYRRDGRRSGRMLAVIGWAGEGERRRMANVPGRWAG